MSTLVVALGVLVGAGAAGAGTVGAAPRGKYSGQTSQRRPISFTLSAGQLTHLKFQIAAACPSGHVWLVTAQKFSPIKVTAGKFSEVFRTRAPSATATVRGRVFPHRVAGSLIMRRFIAREGHSCQGSATFSVRR